MDGTAAVVTPQQVAHLQYDQARHTEASAGKAPGAVTLCLCCATCGQCLGLVATIQYAKLGVFCAPNCATDTVMRDAASSSAPAPRAAPASSHPVPSPPRKSLVLCFVPQFVVLMNDTLCAMLLVQVFPAIL